FTPVDRARVPRRAARIGRARHRHHRLRDGARARRTADQAGHTLGAPRSVGERVGTRRDEARSRGDRRAPLRAPGRRTVACTSALLAAVRSPPPPPWPAEPQTFVVATDGAWIRSHGEEGQRLEGRGALKRLLVALVRKRLESPGLRLDPDALLEIGWPGERPI